ncbi:hypothetical protein FRC03_010663 [Tulasnella sp. 419]|nr:hypothetical protein FRC03_010663 [Tulasnella sp. 419]
MTGSLLHSRWAHTIIFLSTLVNPSFQNSIEPRQSGLQWGSCDPTLSSVIRVACANFTVPLDWTNPSNGQSATLYVAKLPARNGSPLGTIFVNPGGPGSLGTSFLNGRSGEKIMNITGGLFDIVSWDPRGVGFSSPAIRYLDVATPTPQQTLALQENLIFGTLNAQSSGPTQADVDAFHANATNVETYFKSFVQKCVDKNGDNLKYVGTVATVRDLVALADAIEGPGRPIRYWGLSYGTIIGSYLLDLFPERVGRVVLDSVLDATTYSQRVSYQSYATSLEDADDALQTFYDACAAAGPSLCPFATDGSTGASLRQRANDLVDTAYRAVQTNTSNTDHGVITPAVVRVRLVNAAAAPEMWHITADSLSAIYDVFHGGSSVSARSLDRLNELEHRYDMRLRSTVYGSLDTRPSATYAIFCGDSIDSSNVTTTDVYNEIVRVTKDVSNPHGPLEIAVSSSWCHLWPARAVERHTSQGTPKLPNQILLIGNSYDPSTPVSSARKLRDRLNAGGTRQATLIQNDGSGHSSLSMDSACTYDIIKRYFVEGVVPGDTLCGTNFQGFLWRMPQALWAARL